MRNVQGTAAKFQSYFNPDPKMCIFFIDNQARKNESTKRKSHFTDEREEIGKSGISTNEAEDII